MNFSCLPGQRQTMTRKQAQSIVIGLKGYNQNAVTQKTPRLVTGNFPSQKFVEAEQALQSGQEIIIMNEKEFINFLSQRFYLLSQGL